MSPDTEPALELDDIQSGVFSPRPSPYAASYILLRIDEAALGPDHPSVASDLNQVGLVLSALGRSAEALPLHRRALRIAETTLGPEHPTTRRSRTFISETERSG